MRLDPCGTFLLFNGSGLEENVIMFCADMSSYVHVDNNKKYANS